MLTLPASAPAGTVGVDARRGLEPGDFEFAAVGMVMNIGRTCSAARVGRHLALTNRHCLIEEGSDRPLAQIRDRLVPTGDGHHGLFTRGADLGPAIATGLVEGRAANVFAAREAWWGRAGDAGEDWAVIRLDGGTRGPGGEAFTLAPSSTLASVELVGHAGYSESYFFDHHRGHTQTAAHLLARAGNVLVHDAANSRGSSGGPVWRAGTHELLGINAFEVCDRRYRGSEPECAAHATANGAVAVEAFGALVARLLREEN